MPTSEKRRSAPAVTSNSLLSAKLIAVTVKGQPSPGKPATGSFSGTLKKVNRPNGPSSR